MKTGITLITMGAGNVKVLRKTLESFSKICDEVIYGDMLLWEKDREIIKSYQEEFNLKVVPFIFNYIFHNGFSSLLNCLSTFSSNNMILYMNTSEIVDEDYGISEIINNNSDCNAFFFTHKTDPHRWFRMYDKRFLKWSGLIHEQLEGEYRPYHKPIFMMADLEKDMDDSHKAKILNSLKEYVYFQQYVSIVHQPYLLGETDPGWLAFAKNDYDSFMDRLLKRRGQYYSLVRGDLSGFLKYAENPDFEEEIFKSSNKIEFQGSPMFLGKK